MNIMFYVLKIFILYIIYFYSIMDFILLFAMCQMTIHISGQHTRFLLEIKKIRYVLFFHTIINST